MSLYVRGVIGGDVGDGGGLLLPKNPPILEFHPRKNPKTILRKTQNSQSQFKIFSNGFQREKMVLRKTQINDLCQKLKFLTQKTV